MPRAVRDQRPTIPSCCPRSLLAHRFAFPLSLTNSYLQLSASLDLGAAASYFLGTALQLSCVQGNSRFLAAPDCARQTWNDNHGCDETLVSSGT